MLEAIGEKDICLKCGKCCKLVPSLKSYDELCNMAEAGNKTAINFLKLFLPYNSLENAIRIDPVSVDKIIDINKHKFGIKCKTYFFYCRYLNNDNTCGVYKMRPKLCKEYPKSSFTIVPDGCAYEGYLFEKQEEIKKQIRKIKEELKETSFVNIHSPSSDTKKHYENIKNKYEILVEKYRIYGAKDW